MNEKLQQLHDKTMEILGTIGMKFLHPEALEILKGNGIRVDGDVAYFTESQLMDWVNKAPESFTLNARNPEHTVHIGGDSTVLAPCYGAASITDKVGVRHPATFEDYMNYLKLFDANPYYHINGGLLVQPSDIDLATSGLAMFYATLTHSEKCLFVPAGDRWQIDPIMESCIHYFGEDAIAAGPHVLTIVNVNSPLMFDNRMFETLFTFASHGQPFPIVNCSMAGSTSPMTLAGTIAQINAEILPIVALSQMVREGTPVLFGTATATADMATGQIAIGSPEGALCYKYCTELAKFYGLPCRGGGALTDSKLVDAQAGYESMITLMTDYTNHMNLVIHSAGILDGYATTSYEKVIQDFEIIGYLERYMHDIDINDETIPLEVMAEVGHDGEYLTHPHTFDWCRSEPYIPTISSRGHVADPVHQLDMRIDERRQQLMDAYVKPEVDESKLGVIKDILVKAGTDRSLLDRIETM
ncbi:MAG: trimethylamine methyltransferase family protein [Eggerthellaceae bacterium]|nr:trimethylamine methyltransferase family protein [Eggerthellaceae bacterium]